MSLLRAEGLSRRFGGLAALTGLDLSVEKDALVGIIGPNGAGKTTVFNLITGIYRPTSGDILFDGQRIGGLPSNVIASRGIARTFQNIRLFQDLSVLDNVRVAHSSNVSYGPLDAILSRDRMRAEEEWIARRSLELLGLFGLEREALSPARSLPYVSQRRLEIARALALRPRLLLLDEPAAGMNRAETFELMDLIRWMKKEFSLTILLIEHQMDLVMGLCDRITVLDFGVTIAEGEPAEIRRHPRVLESYLGTPMTV